MGIERNLALMTEVVQVNMTARRTSHGSGAWCAPPTHCATAVDDQLADAAVEQCFSKLFAFEQQSGESIAREPESSDASTVQLQVLGSLVLSALFFPSS